jgi:predicted AAA+ superfamily ATPase
VVLLNGARQAGKRTLARLAARRRSAVWHSFDKAVTRAAAAFDPDDFVCSDRMIVIDEVQRHPEILLAIKARVDEQPRPGSFLLTGSARVMGLRSVPDALPGRLETIELWPFSQGEVDGQPDGFIDRVFGQVDGVRPTSDLVKADYADRIARGGLPEAVSRSGRRRTAYFRNYVADLINRDVNQVAEIQRGPEFRALLRLAAARSGAPLNAASLGSAAGLAAGTVSKYLATANQAFLVKLIPAWSRGQTGRVTRRPKLAFVDSGVACHLLGQNEQTLLRLGGPLGGLLDGFAAMELARQATWSATEAEIFHYRTKDQVEVDLVLEDRLGRVVGIEVKASSTVRGEDFRGLRHLAARIGDDFLQGIVLHTGPQTLSFGPKLLAMPLSAIWTVG